MSQGDNGFGLWISILNRQASMYFQRELKLYKLGPGQQAYLLALQANEQIAQEELAKRLQVDKANVSRAIKGLEEVGYISRKNSETDARILLVSLSPQGETVKIAVENIARAWIQSLRSRISEEEWQLCESALKKIALSFR